MKKFALKVYMKIYERMYPILAEYRTAREEYENALCDLRQAKRETALRHAATTNIMRAHLSLRELNKKTAQKIPEKSLKKYQKTLDKYIFICYNKGTKKIEEI